MPLQNQSGLALNEDQTLNSPAKVLWVFLSLGLKSFGGPIAHIGYFRDEFVSRRRWLNDAAYSDLVALCQFLPGPASSQVGFALGLMRAGYLGAGAAWVGFTLPSALALILFAYGAHQLSGHLGMGMLHGLKLVAVAVVAQAVVGMARTLCPDWQRALIAVLAMVLVSYDRSAPVQIGAIALGGAAGLLAGRSTSYVAAAQFSTRVTPRIAIASLAVFTLLLVGLPAMASLGAVQGVALFNAFYRSGALVFGGGHVVLPVLRTAFVESGWVSDNDFLAGYGAAQAIPGPLFTFAAYLGVVAKSSPGGMIGAALGLFGIFLPGMLVLLAALPFWHSLRAVPRMRAAMSGFNAAVVGLLGAALYSPLWTSSVHTRGGFAVAAIGFLLLTWGRVRPWGVVLLGALAGAGLASSDY